ncbi:MAG: ABC transporter ATP-binding protein [Roseitalea sp.]|jgi:NitT/TauT family transport system ATP-binding protein|nr:ABC transporter ATP-binding protein [Roseitalea sp.]MBO6721631.1 ABC transporter ATP-binding protein [Roseitalea sp.]MBO6743387.1 ABC transporter ATP-binding protein [Roseitalea sp.]
MRFETKSGSIEALKDISFNVAQHEFFVVVGPSGCGKSTLLRMVAGLISPTAGHIDVFGLKVTRPREDLGFVFQRPNLLPWLNARDNILFPMRHKYGRVTAEDEDRADELLALVKLQQFAKAMPDELSGGMQQRIGIARALVHDPDILLMDEPFSALDALTREQLTLELQSIWAQHRKTVVFVTHSIPEAVQLGERILVMSDRPGTVSQIITPGVPAPRSPQSLRGDQLGQVADKLRAALLDH